MKGRHFDDEARKGIIRQLRDELRLARDRREIAANHFDEVIRIIPGRLPHPDRSHRINHASREYSAAQEVVTAAILRLNDFVLHGLLRPDQEGRGSGRSTSP